MATRRRFLAVTALCTGSLAGAALGAPRRRGSLSGEEEDLALFLEAVRQGDRAVVGRLLTASPQLAQAQDEAGRSALILAYLGEHEDVAQLILEHEPAIGLVEAVLIPDWGRMEQIVAEDPGAIDAWHPVGGTAMYAMARTARSGFWRLQYLGADSDANPRGAQGVTPAYGALECESATDALRGATSLLSNGGDVNAPQRGGDSLLHCAAGRGDARVVRFLVRRGARVAARNARGATALEVAQRLGQRDVATLLQEHEQIERDHTATRYSFDASGAPVQWPDLSDVSIERQNEIVNPSHGNLARVRELVDPDARLALARSVQDELGIEAAGHTSNRDVIRYYLDRGAPMSIATALSLGELDRARAMLKADPLGIHERGPHDFALLWYASIGGGSVEAAELLLEAGVHVDQESQGTTTLYQAAGRGQLDLMRFLLDKGAQVDAVGYHSEREGRTPLQVAQEGGHDAAVRLLREHGAS